MPVDSQKAPTRRYTLGNMGRARRGLGAAGYVLTPLHAERADAPVIPGRGARTALSAGYVGLAVRAHQERIISVGNATGIARARGHAKGSLGYRA